MAGQPHVPPPLRKALAYITRRRQGRRELLVFTHRDYPEAGLQVPAGTAKRGETIEATLLREIKEETGLTRLTVMVKVGVFHYRHPITGRLHVRHVFHLEAPHDAPDCWQWIETSGGEVPEHEGYVFQFHWADLDGSIELTGSQGDYLSAIRES